MLSADLCTELNIILLEQLERIESICITKEYITMSLAHVYHEKGRIEQVFNPVTIDIRAQTEIETTNRIHQRQTLVKNARL